MNGRKLILNDGTVIEDGTCGQADGVLWCYLPDGDIRQAFALFSDPEKTARIRFIYGEMEDVYEGYTDLTAIAAGQDGEIRVQLRKTEVI